MIRLKRIHMPVVDARHWVAITLASIFGTNSGDLYAHGLGLGIGGGLALLCAIVALVFLIERLDTHRTELFYWLAIIIIRTGATNIADFLAFRLRIPAVPLGAGLVAVLALFAWGADRRSPQAASPPAATLPATGLLYWAAMLTAGVLGTALGDDVSHLIGEGNASVLLGAVLLSVVWGTWRRTVAIPALYWLTVAVARTTGTSMGDWVAENKFLDIGLPVSTLLTGPAFLAVLVFWPSLRDADDDRGPSPGRR